MHNSRFVYFPIVIVVSVFIPGSSSVSISGNLSNLVEDNRNSFDRERERSNQSSTGSDGNFVIVVANPNGYHHEIKNFSISGGCGQPNKQNDTTVAIYKGYNNCLGDTYSYSLVYKERSLATSGSDKTCSGSFTISGNQSNASLQINSSCNATFSEF